MFFVLLLSYKRPCALLYTKGEAAGWGKCFYKSSHVWGKFAMPFKYHTGCIPAFLLAKIDSSEIFLILYVFIFFPQKFIIMSCALFLRCLFSSICVLFDFKCPQTLKPVTVANPWYFGSVSTDDVKCKKCRNEFLSLGLLPHIKVIIPSRHTDIGGLSRDLN